MVNTTANAFGMELAVQSVNQLAQTTEVTVSEKVNLALLAGSDVALDTKKVVLDGAWRIVSPIHLAYLSAKFAQPTGKALVVVSQQDILGNFKNGHSGTGRHTCAYQQLFWAERSLCLALRNRHLPFQN